MNDDKAEQQELQQQVSNMRILKIADDNRVQRVQPSHESVIRKDNSTHHSVVIEKPTVLHQASHLFLSIVTEFGKNLYRIN